VECECRSAISHMQAFIGVCRHEDGLPGHGRRPSPRDGSLCRVPERLARPPARMCPTVAGPRHTQGMARRVLRELPSAYDRIARACFAVAHDDIHGMSKCLAFAYDRRDRTHKFKPQTNMIKSGGRRLPPRQRQTRGKDRRRQFVTFDKPKTPPSRERHTFNLTKFKRLDSASIQQSSTFHRRHHNRRVKRESLTFGRWLNDYLLTILADPLSSNGENSFAYQLDRMNTLDSIMGESMAAAYGVKRRDITYMSPKFLPLTASRRGDEKVWD